MAGIEDCAGWVSIGVSEMTGSPGASFMKAPLFFPSLK